MKQSITHELSLWPIIWKSLNMGKECNQWKEWWLRQNNDVCEVWMVELKSYNLDRAINFVNNEIEK